MFRNYLCAAALAVSLIATGCQREEKVLEIKTPSGSLEVNKSSTGTRVETEGNPPAVDVQGPDVKVRTPGNP